LKNADSRGVSRCELFTNAGFSGVHVIESGAGGSQSVRLLPQRISCVFAKLQFDDLRVQRRLCLARRNVRLLHLECKDAHFFLE
jgi:hypothetical protein